jgi:hypothetical protein
MSLRQKNREKLNIFSETFRKENLNPKMSSPSPEENKYADTIVFDVECDFEIFLYIAIPFITEMERIYEFVNTTYPTRPRRWKDDLTFLIKDYSKSFIKCGEKNLNALKKVPTKTEMGAIFNTIRTVAQLNTDTEKYRNRSKLTNDFLNSAVMKRRALTDEEIMKNNNAIKKYSDIMSYLSVQSPNTKWVAKYSSDKKKVYFTETWFDPTVESPPTSPMLEPQFVPILLRGPNWPNEKSYLPLSVWFPEN